MFSECSELHLVIFKSFLSPSLWDSFSVFPGLQWLDSLKYSAVKSRKVAPNLELSDVCHVESHVIYSGIPIFHCILGALQNWDVCSSVASSYLTYSLNFLIDDDFPLFIQLRKCPVRLLKCKVAFVFHLYLICLFFFSIPYPALF